MKTYEQVINQAVLIGAHSYFGGGNRYDGYNDLVCAASFIYDVDREKFMNDYENRWQEVMQKAEADNMFADDVIAYIKNS